MEDLTGQMFGPYRIVAPLGEGGMAAVYKAYQPAVDRYVALKVLPRHFTADPQFLGRFRHEAKIVAQFQHPHILPVFDFGESDGYTFLVMPFIHGGTLAALMKGQPIAIDVTQRVVRQIGEALDYAHSKGVIHRDIKPTNILMDERGNCLVADFGIARMAEGSTHLTITGAVIGTPAYMSPEQAIGETVGPESDVYSLGIVLYEMLTGRVPFMAETPIAVALKHLNSPLPPPRTINPNLSPAVEAVVLKALARARGDRYQTADQLTTALTAADHQAAAATIPEARPVHPTSAPTVPLRAPARVPTAAPAPAPVPAPSPVPTPSKHRVSRVLWAGAAAVAVVAAVLAFRVMRTSTTPPTQPAQPPPVVATAPEGQRTGGPGPRIPPGRAGGPPPQAAVPNPSAPEAPPVAAPAERSTEPKPALETSSEPPEWRAVLEAVRAGDTGRLGDALRELNAQAKPATIDRQEARRLNDRWLGLGRGGRMAGPLPLLERAHEADPADPEIAGNLADALMRRGNLPKALGLAIDSVRLSPRRSASWGLLGFLYAKLDRPADAAGCLVVGHHFAPNKQQTIRVYTRLAETDPDPRVQAAMNHALTRIGEPR